MDIKHGQPRFEQFSDGVFAIAITLLAIELHVPKIISSGFLSGVSEIMPLAPNLLTFVLSFVTIAIFWVNHHQLTQTMGPVKRRVLWSNILFLMFVTLIPFGTNVVALNILQPLAVATYSLVLLGSSTSFTLMRYFIHHSCGERNFPMRRSFVGPAFYLLAVLTAPFSVYLAYFFLVIPPLYYFLPHQHELS